MRIIKIPVFSCSETQHKVLQPNRHVSKSQLFTGDETWCREFQPHRSQKELQLNQSKILLVVKFSVGDFILIFYLKSSVIHPSIYHPSVIYLSICHVFVAQAQMCGVG